MEVTKREILFSIIILSLMVWAGVSIHDPITSSLLKDAMEISESHKVGDPEKFGYLRRTEAGLFMAEGVLEAIRPKTLPELKGRGYLEIKKIREEYREHIETYTTTDGKGHTTVHTRVYHSWDEVDHERWVCDSVSFLGQRFSLREVSFRYFPRVDTTIYKETRRWGANTGDTRYVYLTWPARTQGLLRGCAKKKWYMGLEFRAGGNIKQAKEDAERDIKVVPIVFWVFWILLTAGLIIGFYYLENRWLEDG